VNTTIEGLFPFHGDPILIEVIFSNIISNSIKFRHPHETKPTLDIHVVLHADKVELSFKDNGIGIDRFHLNKVFDMFFCAPENKNAGSGLGLFAVKEAVKKLKGSIRVESIKGTGTTIFAELPNQMDNDLKRKISKIIENSK
jgi:signal transduction histidine kinase